MEQVQVVAMKLRKAMRGNLEWKQVAWLPGKMQMWICL